MIRERLREWANENEDELKSEAEVRQEELGGRAGNYLTRTQASASPAWESLIAKDEGMATMVESDSMEMQDHEVGVDSRQPGDLVEIRYSLLFPCSGTLANSSRPLRSRLHIFAIYLGFKAGRHHFYGSHGRWMISVGYGSLFTVSNFISKDELRPVLDELPAATRLEELEKARDDDKGPSRATASILLKKMQDFKLESEKIYLENMDSLDRARAQLSDPNRVKYLSLFEIAEILLPRKMKDAKTNVDNFSPAALYAVHTALFRDEIAFRPLSPTSDCHRRDHLFEVFPKKFLQVINRVSTMIRSHWVELSQTEDMTPERALQNSPFGEFIEQARKVVLLNREMRGYSNGSIAPSDQATIAPETPWSQSSWEIISFLQWWASYDLFEEGSRFSAYGSVIIRALDLYDDLFLGKSVAWTFLQEAGIVPLWEVPSRYKIRFPDTGIIKGGGLARALPPDVATSTRPDIAADYRVDKPLEKVFAIDGPGAVLIDDGISLEKTEKEDEFWIHVHAADPAAGVKPQSNLSKFMELIPENIYLQGHFQAMLSGPKGGGAEGELQTLVERYSLAPDRPALTFSAKVNFGGEILDYKVEPTQLHDVVYMDPSDVAKLCNEPRPPAGTSDELVVGTPPVPGSEMPNRQITHSSELDHESKETLLTLYRLAEALKAKRLEKGAWPYYFPGSSVQVAFQPTTAGNEEVPGMIPPDPYIKIGTGQDTTSSIVGNLMVLAGQVAARWASDRNIPVPFRKDTNSTANFDAAYKYATEVLYPQIRRGSEPSMDQRSRLSNLTGAVTVSTTPGPHFLMGIDMYAKATSPLRRYSDLLVHWQIHAALAAEHNLKRRLDPAKDDLDAILPFPKDQLDNTVALLHMREKMARIVSRSDKDWILMALDRAHRFEGFKPKNLRFVVTSRWRSGLLGRLDFFKLPALLPLENFTGLSLMKNVSMGDEFEVELCTINVHSGDIHVKALKYHPVQREEPREQVKAGAAAAVA